MVTEAFKHPRQKGVCFGSASTIKEEISLLFDWPRNQRHRESNCHSSSSFTRFAHDDTLMTTNDAEASTDSDSEDEHYDHIPDSHHVLRTLSLSPEAWIVAAEHQWRNKVDVAMKAFRTCTVDDSDDIVAFNRVECDTDSGVPAFVKRNMTEKLTKIQQIEQWRNDFMSESEDDDISYDDADYYTTPHFQFP